MHRSTRIPPTPQSPAAGRAPGPTPRWRSVRPYRARSSRSEGLPALGLEPRLRLPVEQVDDTEARNNHQKDCQGGIDAAGDDQDLAVLPGERNNPAPDHQNRNDDRG